MLVPTHGPSGAELPDGGRAKETRMSYASSLLAKDEVIIYRGRQHWLAPISDSLKPFVLVLVGLLLFVGEVNLKATGPLLVLPAAFLVVGLVWIGIVDLTWRAQE